MRSTHHRGVHGLVGGCLKHKSWLTFGTFPSTSVALEKAAIMPPMAYHCNLMPFGENTIFTRLAHLDRNTCGLVCTLGRATPTMDRIVCVGIAPEDLGNGHTL